MVWLSYGLTLDSLSPHCLIAQPPDHSNANFPFTQSSDFLIGLHLMANFSTTDSQISPTALTPITPISQTSLHPSAPPPIHHSNTNCKISEWTYALHPMWIDWSINSLTLDALMLTAQLPAICLIPECSNTSRPLARLPYARWLKCQSTDHLRPYARPL